MEYQFGVKATKKHDEEIAVIEADSIKQAKQSGQSFGEWVKRQDEKINKSLYRWTEQANNKTIKDDFVENKKTEDVDNILNAFIEKGGKNKEYIYYPTRPADKLAEIITQNIPENTKYPWVRSLDGKDIYQAFEGDIDAIKKWVNGASPGLVDSKVYNAFDAADRNKVAKEFKGFLDLNEKPRAGTKKLQFFTKKDFKVGDEITYNHPLSTFSERYRTYDYEAEYFKHTFGDKTVVIEPSKNADTVVDLTENSAFNREREMLLPPGVKIKVKEVVGDTIYADVEIPTKKELIDKYGKKFAKTFPEDKNNINVITSDNGYEELF
jgi:hypothetical protein